MTDLTPAKLAELDQAWAERAEVLDRLIAGVAFAVTIDPGVSAHLHRTALAEALRSMFSHRDCTELLGGAIYRLATDSPEPAGPPP